MIHYHVVTVQLSRRLEAHWARCHLRVLGAERALEDRERRYVQRHGHRGRPVLTVVAREILEVCRHVEEGRFHLLVLGRHLPRMEGGIRCDLPRKEGGGSE